MTLRMGGLETFANGYADAVDRGAQETAEDVADLAAQLAPVDEGDLRDTIRVEPKAQEGQRTVAVGGIAGPHKFVDYAVWVEYGGGENNPAQPFWTPAATRIDAAFRYKALLKALERRSRV